MTDNMIYFFFIFFIAYFLLLFFLYIAFSILSFFESKKRMYESGEESYAILQHTSFTLPVSIIVPAHNEENWISQSLNALINLDYPQFEIIIVDDGSTDKTPEILNEQLYLKSEDRSYTSEFITGKINEVFRSMKYPNITVLRKEKGMKKAGALNAGLHFAKYRYICVIDSDTILEPDAFIKLMGHVEKDPENVVAIGSYFGLINGFKLNNGRIEKRSFSYNPLIAYQNLEYLRNFIGNRVAWSRLNAIPIISGGLGIWRRDFLIDVGGYLPDFTCEDLEITFRAQDYFIKKNKEYKMQTLPDYIGWTEGPSNIKALITQRSRWQRVTNETVWKYKYMLFNPKYKWFGFLVFPYYLLYETLGVFFEIFSIMLVGLACYKGVLNVAAFWGYLIFMLLIQTATSVLVIFEFVRGQKIFPKRYLVYMIILSVTEIFLYRWVLSLAKILGTIDFLKGVRTFDQYKRTEA